MTAPSISPDTPRAERGADVDRFIGHLQRQVEIFEQLDRLAGEQSDLIANHATDQLLALLAQRQQLINELLQLNDAIEPVRKQWPTFRATLQEPRRSEIGQLLEKVQMMLASIIEKDDSDRAKLAAERDQVGVQMKQTVNAGQALRAYANRPKAIAPRFADGKQ